MGAHILLLRIIFFFCTIQKSSQKILEENSENDEEHIDKNEEENDENALKIVYSGIRIWGINFRSVKWSEYIRISDNSDIRTSTLDHTYT